MNNKNTNNTTEISLLKSIIEEKYLLVIILIIFSLLSIYLGFEEQKKLKETNTQAIVRAPYKDFFLIAEPLLNSEHFNDNINQDTLKKEILLSSIDKFNFDLSLNLSSVSNLNYFLNQKINSEYLQGLIKNGIKVEEYFKGENFKIMNIPNDNSGRFGFVLLIKHPLDFNAKDFLKDYIDFTFKKTVNEYIRSKLSLAESIILNLQKNIKIKKNSSNSELLEKIIIVEEKKKEIANLTVEPFFEINTNLYIEKNNIKKNLVISLLLSFIVFFSILIFKQFYKNILEK
jgi:hypothetical protein